MENASKALLMAASVLIGMMIITLAVYLFVTFGQTSAEVHEQRRVQQLQEFNNQFTQYEGKDEITIYDVIKIAGLATDNNISYNFDTIINVPADNKVSDYYIWVILDGKNVTYGKNEKDINKKYSDIIKDKVNEIGNNQTSLKNYTCSIDISSITGRVYKVIFKQK